MSDVQDKFWTYRADKPLPAALAPYNLTPDEWKSLSPGMRRTIQRDIERNPVKDRTNG